MKRRERMEWYIERIRMILQNLPTTEASEIECEALWMNLINSHTDRAIKLKTEARPCSTRR